MIDRQKFDKLAEAVEQIKKDSAETRLAVCGDKELGVTGLVKRVEKLEKKDRRRELRLATFTGVLIGAVEGLKHWFSRWH